MNSSPKEKIKVTKTFDWLKLITVSKTPIDLIDEDSWSCFEPFILNRVLSMNPNYLELVNMIQKIPYENKKHYYKIYCDLIPKDRTYSKYLKPEKLNLKNDLINYLNKYFMCSTRETLLNLQILSSNDIKNILSKFGLEEKEIKKIMK